MTPVLPFHDSWLVNLKELINAPEHPTEAKRQVCQDKANLHILASKKFHDTPFVINGDLGGGKHCFVILKDHDLFLRDLGNAGKYMLKKFKNEVGLYGTVANSLEKGNASHRDLLSVCTSAYEDANRWINMHQWARIALKLGQVIPRPCEHCTNCEHFTNSLFSPQAVPVCFGCPNNSNPSIYRKMKEASTALEAYAITMGLSTDDAASDILGDNERVDATFSPISLPKDSGFWVERIMNKPNIPYPHVLIPFRGTEGNVLFCMLIEWLDGYKVTLPLIALTQGLSTKQHFFKLIPSGWKLPLLNEDLLAMRPHAPVKMTESPLVAWMKTPARPDSEIWTSSFGGTETLHLVNRRLLQGRTVTLTPVRHSKLTDEELVKRMLRIHAAIADIPGITIRFDTQYLS